MERLDLGDSTLPIRIFGQDIDLKKPSMKQIFDNEEKLKDAGDDAKKMAQLMMRFLVDMGMPKDVADNIAPDQVERIMEHLKGSKKN